MTDAEKDKIYKDFTHIVNMTPVELEAFLKTPESLRVGQKSTVSGESIGHMSGRKIVKIKRTAKDKLTEADYAHMKRVISYCARHLKQGGPAQDKEHSKWRYSLMNWGHDPMKT